MADFNRVALALPTLPRTITEGREFSHTCAIGRFDLSAQSRLVALGRLRRFTLEFAGPLHGFEVSCEQLRSLSPPPAAKRAGRRSRAAEEQGAGLGDGLNLKSGTKVTALWGAKKGNVIRDRILASAGGGAYRVVEGYAGTTDRLEDT